MLLMQAANAETDILLELLKLVIPQTLLGVGGWTGIVLIAFAAERRYRLVTRILDIWIPRLNGKRKTDEHKAVPAAAAPTPFDEPMLALAKVIVAQQNQQDKCEDDLKALTIDHSELNDTHAALKAVKDTLDAQIRALKAERDGLKMEVAALQAARKPAEPAAFVEAGDDEDTAELKATGDKNKP